MLLLERFFPGFGWIEIGALIVYATVLTHVMVQTKNIGRWRSLYWRIFSLIFFSQLILGLTVSSTFLMSGQLHIPVPAVIIAGPLYRGEGLFMLSLFGGTSMFVGAAWCGHLCYIGACDDIAAKIKDRPMRNLPPPKYIRYLILAVIIVIPLFLRLLRVSNVTATILAVSFGVIGLVIMLIFSYPRGQMVHCTTYCPIGALAVALGKINPFRVRINTTSCNRCGICTFSCRYGALSDEDLNMGRAGWNCVLCGDCLSMCPKKSIRMTLGESEKDMWPIYASLIVSLHAIFIGLARI
jgi:polyferredoxin